MVELLMHSVSVCKQNRQQSHALMFACYATQRGRREVSKYLDVSSEEKTVTDFDTDCRYLHYLFEILERVLVHGVHLRHASDNKVHNRVACSHRTVLLTSQCYLLLSHLGLFQPSTNHS